MTMSPAMTVTIASPPPTPQPTDSFDMDGAHATRCPSCGDPAPKAATTNNDTRAAEAALARAQSQIRDLEGQVMQLNEKATAAVYRCAAYEEQLSRMRAATHSPPPTADPSPLPSPAAPRNSPLRGGSLLSSQRLSSLLGARKQPDMQMSVSLESVDELVAALARERGLRAEAEETVRRTGEEAEELSVELFERANEMVAGERRERARLEERLGVLEGREVARSARMGVLEGCMERIESARALLDKEAREQRERVQQEREKQEKQRETKDGEREGRDRTSVRERPRSVVSVVMDDVSRVEWDGTEAEPEDGIRWEMIRTSNDREERQQIEEPPSPRQNPQEMMPSEGTRPRVE